MRLSTLGRAAGGLAAGLYLASAVASAFGHQTLFLLLVIASAVLGAPVVLYALLFLPAPRTRARRAVPQRTSLPAATRPALPAAETSVRTAALPHARGALPGRPTR